jgi:Leucine-rich repeat (LRR) protein
MNTFCDEQWLQTSASLTALITSLDLSFYRHEVSDDRLLALAGLDALISLNLASCGQVSDDGLLSLAGLTALTSLDLGNCQQVSDDGLLSLAGLTALTSLNLALCTQVPDDGLRITTGQPHCPHQPQLVRV